MADLLAYQFDDVDDGEATAKSREDRKRRAFLDSKVSYPQEPVVILPGWFMQSTSDLASFSAESDAKDVVLAVQRLYLQREYHRALNISLDVMDKMIATDTSGCKASSHSRELQDLALRSAIKTGQVHIAARLADQTNARWEAMPGSAASAGEAYLLAERPRDAISALLAATKNRPYLHRHLLSLAKAFEMLADPLKLDELNECEKASFHKAVASLVCSLREAAGRGAALEDSGPWSANDGSPQRERSAMGEPAAADPVSHAEVASCLQSFGLSDGHCKQLLELCAYNPKAKAATADEVDTLRSVRSL
ncbi:hypothetical protein FRC01_012533 [Tulasnella sp. 417]|nr:hypothetical protein FRC01_012533 [Tulasnella sp. 417]